MRSMTVLNRRDGFGLHPLVDCRGGAAHFEMPGMVAVGECNDGQPEDTFSIIRSDACMFVLLTNHTFGQFTER